VVSDWKAGSPFSLVLNRKTTDVGEILEADRPRRLSYTFRHILNEAARKERPSRVTFVLEQYGKLVKLTLTHEDFAEDSVVIDGISKGWPAIMSSLKSMLESGTALVIPFDALFIADLEEAYHA
jgi:uncharacterized protein YndB with AHSA1/START domain